MTSTAQEEACRLIAFYDKHGWDWTDALTYLLMRSTGRIDRYLYCYCHTFKTRPTAYAPPAEGEG